METKIIQITAGRGPAECSRVVAKVLELMLKAARSNDIDAEVLDKTAGDLNGTLSSATIKVSAKDLSVFIKEWQGTIQWIAQSPYRKFHKRKNWFVGVEVFELTNKMMWQEKDVVFETCRSSGPGGQNVNKVETAVRGLHRPSGIQVIAMDSRSQLQNRKLCWERLKAKVEGQYFTSLMAQQQSQWQEHNVLERGNAVKVITQPL
jgi:peptide chain release factor